MCVAADWFQTPLSCLSRRNPNCLELVSNGGDAGESLLETVGVEGTELRFSCSRRSDLEGEAAEDTRRAGGYSGGGRSSESKQGEATRVGCVDRNWVAAECIWVASSLNYEREYIRSVLFTRAASADLRVGQLMSAPIWFEPSLLLLRISFPRIEMTKASVFSLHNVLVLDEQWYCGCLDGCHWA